MQVRPASECNKIVIVSPPRAGPDERGQEGALAASVGNRVFFLFQFLQFPWMGSKALFFFVIPFRSSRERFGLVRTFSPLSFSPIFGLNSISLNLKPEPRKFRGVDEIKRKNIESGLGFI